jgi:CheY-like chemotaxis protein
VQALANEALRGCHVLVVEDEMLVGMELESLLERQGCAVIGPASTVGRALALLDHEQVDAALLDLNLNGEPATPVAAALTTQGVPFVLVTGYREAQSSEPSCRAQRVCTSRSTTKTWCVPWPMCWRPSPAADSLAVAAFTSGMARRRARTFEEEVPVKFAATSPTRR